jgi:TonB family protein
MRLGDLRMTTKQSLERFGIALAGIILAVSFTNAVRAERPRTMEASDENGSVEIIGHPSVETVRSILNRYERRENSVGRIGAGAGHGSSSRSPARARATETASAPTTASATATAIAPAPMATGSGLAGGRPLSPAPIAGGAPTRGGSELKASSKEAYMSDLQRRIKRAWFPPKGYESKRIEIAFTIHRGGELSNLRLDHSCGVAVADQACLKAVENAAPFRPLPPDSSEEAAIEFVFDYNLYSGGGHGTFRTF